MPDSPTAAAALDSSLTDYVAGFVVATRTGRSVRCGPPRQALGARRHRSRPCRRGVAEAGGITRRYLAALGIATHGGSTVIGSDMRLPARFAAFANGISIHADDYDDTQLAVAKDRVYGLLTHPTAPALPPVLALAERDRRSGRDLMTAYQVGVEVECKVAEAIMPRHYQHGFHSTATCGAIGAAAATAKLLGLDRESTRRALSLGASQAAGLRENFGTMTKPFHAGRAAESGVVAAELAALGFTASLNGLEADRGFFRAAGGGYSADMINGRLGNPWTFAFPGVSIKPHPSGSLTHPGMAVMLDADPSSRSATGARQARRRRDQSQHAECAHSSSPAQRVAGQVQHGILHGDPAARAQGRSRAIYRRSGQPPRRAGVAAARGLRRQCRSRGRRVRQDDDDHRSRTRRRHDRERRSRFRQGQPRESDER